MNVLLRNQSTLSPILILPHWSTPRFIPKNGESPYAFRSSGFSEDLCKIIIHLLNDTEYLNLYQIRILNESMTINIFRMLINNQKSTCLNIFNVFNGWPSGCFSPVTGSTVVNIHLPHKAEFRNKQSPILMYNQLSSSNGLLVPKRV